MRETRHVINLIPVICRFAALRACGGAAGWWAGERRGVAGVGASGTWVAGAHTASAAAAAGCAMGGIKVLLSPASPAARRALCSTATCRKRTQIGIFQVVSFMVWVKIGIGIRSLSFHVIF